MSVHSAQSICISVEDDSALHLIKYKPEGEGPGLRKGSLIISIDGAPARWGDFKGAACIDESGSPEVMIDDRTIVVERAPHDLGRCSDRTPLTDPQLSLIRSETSPTHSQPRGNGV